MSKFLKFYGANSKIHIITVGMEKMRSKRLGKLRSEIRYGWLSSKLITSPQLLSLEV